MAKWQGKPITVLREANANDAGYIAANGNQSYIRQADGIERVVKTNDITNDALPHTPDPANPQITRQSSHVPARVRQPLASDPR